MANFIGTSGNDSFNGTNENDFMTGDAGNDTLFGSGDDDTLAGDSGDDSLNGGFGKDTLLSGEGNDTLNGSFGSDLLNGGSGNDTYILVNSSASILEDANGGIDTVVSNANFVLGDHLENLELLGSANRGEGNSLENTITANSSQSSLLRGKGGNDILVGGNGNDTLDGGTERDTMRGELGNDTYIVGNTFDQVIEGLNAGSDTVESSLSFTLGSNLENLTLIGGSNLNGTGNALSNLIQGNIGSNLLKGEAGNDRLFGDFGKDTLDGGTGSDTLNGGRDSDTYIVDSTGDVVIEVTNDFIEGLVTFSVTDTVQSSVSFTLGNFVENLVLTGTAAINGTGNNLGNNLTGNSAGNNLDGKEGNDTLNGAGGNDILVGGAGLDNLNGGVGNDVLLGGAAADRFIFNAGAVFPLTNLGVDIIKDFRVGLDKVVLSNFGRITAAQIAIVANDSDAAISAGQITYSATSGNLFFNKNGVTAGFGTGGQFATLDNAPLLSAADFQITA